MNGPLLRNCLYLYMKGRYRLDGILYDLAIRKGCPSHVVKRRVVRYFAKAYRLRCFIESGTYWGDMCAAMARHFDEIHSIELSAELYLKAKDRFRAKPHVHLYWGDSGTELARILRRCGTRALFWLDAHYSGVGTARGAVDTPIMREVSHILRHDVRGHVILIDDSRCFVGENGYPRISELRNFAAQHGPDYSMAVDQDIIRLVPATARCN